MNQISEFNMIKVEDIDLEVREILDRIDKLPRTQLQQLIDLYNIRCSAGEERINVIHIPKPTSIYDFNKVKNNI